MAEPVLEEAEQTLGNEPYVESCDCTVCDRTFSLKSKSIVDTARAVANHWNETHQQILKNTYTAFQATERVEKEEGNLQHIRKKKHYISVYDVLETENKARVFDPAFTENATLSDICECCQTTIENSDCEKVHDPPGLPVAKYLCKDCEQAKKIERRKQNNKQLTAFE